MQTSRVHIGVHALVLCGLLIHLKTAFRESSDPWSGFTVGLLLWSLLPYLVIELASRKSSWGALCAAVAVFLADLYVHLAVFVWPGSSTAPLGLVAMPLWNLVLVVPVSFVAGYVIEKRFKNKDEWRRPDLHRS